MRGTKTPWGIGEGYAMINEFELIYDFLEQILQFWPANSPLSLVHKFGTLSCWPKVVE